MNNTDISVIIPTYKPGSYVWECLDSVYTQTFPGKRYEVIIILNGCSEPYYSQIEEYISSHSDRCTFSLIQTDVSGVSNARNIGIENSNGKYLTFVDDDDIISENYLEELLKVSDEETIGCANSFIFKKDISHHRESFTSAAYRKVNGKPFDIFQFRQFLSSVWAKLIHRNIIGKNRFPTQLRLSEDCVFCLDLSLSMKSMRLASPSAIYYQRLREESAMHLKTSWLTDIKELSIIEVAYLKFWIVHFWKVNPLLMLSRIAAGIRNTRIKLKNK